MLCDFGRKRITPPHTARAGLPILREHYRPSINSFMHTQVALRSAGMRKILFLATIALAVASSDVRGQTDLTAYADAEGTLTCKH